MAAVGRRVQGEKNGLEHGQIITVVRNLLLSSFQLQCSWVPLLHMPSRNIHIQVMVICQVQSHLSITLDSLLSEVDQMTLKLWPTLAFPPYAIWAWPADTSPGQSTSQLSVGRGQIVLDPCLREQLAFLLWSTTARDHSRNMLLFSGPLPGHKCLACHQKHRVMVTC